MEPKGRRVTDMVDRARDGRMVILPQPDRLHAFQRSDFHTFCDLCGGRRNDRAGLHVTPDRARYGF